MIRQTDLPSTESGRLSAAMRLELAELEVSDLARSVDFYRETVGLVPFDRETGRAELGGEGGAPVLRLVERPGVRRRPSNAPGLFHLAILLPERRDLALAFARLSARGLLTGASDHRVSEALYLDDPDGLGVEIYCDRPREDWPIENGRLKMATNPIDATGLRALAAEMDDIDAAAPAGARLGHVHLQAGDLDSAGAFWLDAVGLDLTTTYPGALFMSAGGYHHHVATNVWASRGAGVEREGVARLNHFEMLLPSAVDVAAVRERLSRAGAKICEHGNGGVSAADPFGCAVLLRSV